MLFTGWFRRARRPALFATRLDRAFRPMLQTLEDRTVPSASGRVSAALFGSFTPGAATHLQVVVPPSARSGTSFSVLVAAEDASNHIATGYTGTVHLALATADGGAALPADYTFTAKDHGIHQFVVTLAATGGESVVATDTATSSITGSATTTVTPAPVPTQVVVVTQQQAAVGVPTSVTVKILDASGHVIPNYTGTVTLTRSDPQETGSTSKQSTAASLPITYAFTASDHGQHTSR